MVATAPQIREINIPEDACLTDEQADKLAGTYIGHDTYDLVVDFDANVLKPDGSPLIIFRKGVLPRSLCEQAWRELRKIHVTPTNRGMASGKATADSASVQVINPNGLLSKTVTSMASAEAMGLDYVIASGERKGEVVAAGAAAAQLRGSTYVDGRPVKKDGTVSKTVRMYDAGVRDQSSGIIGSFDRYARTPYCRLTAFNLDEKKSPMTRVVPFIQAVDAVFGALLPDRYGNQRVWVDRTETDWIIPGTAFTTVTVNKNYRTAVHKDAGDLKEGFGVMSVLEAGIYTGGYLCFPKYRVAVDMRTTDVCCADVHSWHGNMPFVGKKGRYERVSCVFYYRAQMFKCLSHRGELERAQNRKQGEPLWAGSKEEYWKERGVTRSQDAVSASGATVYKGEGVEVGSLADNIIGEKMGLDEEGKE
jgi:hypothetical protein